MKRILFATAMIIFFFGGHLLYGQTKGEGWLLYYIDDNTKNRFYFDKLSLSRVEKDRITIWQKITEEIRPNDEQEIMRVHLQMDCRQKTYEVLNVVNVFNITGGGDEHIRQKKRSIEDGQLRALLENICP